MREIIFRGKRIDNGEWVEGFYIKANYHWHNHGIHEDWIATDTVQNGGWCNVRGKHAVDPETVGQYTGLTDKNGKKIFEGDIVRCYFADGYEEEGSIRWSNADVRFSFVPFDEKYLWGIDNTDKFEIIGNIHDNPELLKGGVQE